MHNAHNKILLKNENETVQFAINIAQNIKATNILALTGDLGSGKTFICREIIRYFCGNAIEVQSPTFNILKTYQSSSFIIYHFDLYRLKSVHEIYELGFEEAFQGLCLIEWPEVMMQILPESAFKLHLQIIDEYTRSVILTPSNLLVI